MNEQNGAGSSVVGTIAETLGANSSRKVFGEPFTSGEVTVIPAARISGGGGGGGGGANAPGAAKSMGGEGAGGGLGQSARPVGAFVVKGSRVAWRPAVDMNRVILGGQIVAIFGLVVLRELIKRRHSRAMLRRMRRHG